MMIQENISSMVYLRIALTDENTSWASRLSSSTSAKVREMCRMVRRISPGSEIVVGGHDLHAAGAGPGSCPAE